MLCLTSVGYPWHHRAQRVFLQVYSAWPDLSLSARYLVCFAMLGEIEEPPMFRPLVVPKVARPREHLFKSAENHVNELSRQATADDAVRIATQKDLDRVSNGKLPEVFDKLYGVAAGFPCHVFRSTRVSIDAFGILGKTSFANSCVDCHGEGGVDDETDD